MIGLALAMVVAFVALLYVAGVVARDRARSGAVAAPLQDVISSEQPAAAPFAGLTETRVAVGGRCLRVVVADTEAERERGLMNRTDLGPYDGMLFIVPNDSSDAFWMGGTRVPLDIGWYDRQGATDGNASMVPCPADVVSRCPQYHAQRDWRFALETLRNHLPTGALGGC
jgi:uncharacterized membrane protein (UPF0127 family)